MKASPRIIAIAAVTADGRIALHSHHFTSWTSVQDKKVLHALLDKADVVVVGSRTYRTAQAPLSRRFCIVFTSSVRTTKRRSPALLLCNPRRVDVRKLLASYRTVAVLGGTQTYTYFWEHRLLHELYLTIEPLVFGAGLNLFEVKVGRRVDLRLVTVKRLNKKGSLLLHYRVLGRGGE